jgi:hypothetical protein
MYRGIDDQNSGRNTPMNKYICYCFCHTREDIEQDLEKHGRSTIMERIMAESKKGNCNCATNNPKGR